MPSCAPTPARLAVGSRGSASERGQVAAILSVQKAPGTNTLSLTAALDRALEQAAATVPAAKATKPDKK